MGVNNKDNIHNLSIVIIGAGNLAANLAKALYKKKFRILQIYSRTEEPAKSLAEQINAGWTTDLNTLNACADLYIISIKDSAFPELLPDIIQGKTDGLFVHTSGSIPLEIWKTRVKRYGVLYPLQTFSKYREPDFNKIPFFIEAGNEKDEQILITLAEELSQKVYKANSDQRKSLHVAAVFACNFTNHLYAIASDILEKNHLPFDILLPLIDETAAKVHELSPAEAQTGPAIRYDENIINSHLEMLSGDPALQQLYRLLSSGIYNKSNKNKE